MNNINQPGDIDRVLSERARPKVARSGDADSSFGENGRVTVPHRGFALPTGDGKYWTIAERGSPPARLEVRRLLEDGARDPSFPLNGTIVDLYLGAKDFVLYASRLQSTGKIIVGGRLDLADDTSVPLYARLGLDGLLDPSFGDGGIKVIEFKDANQTYVYGIDIQPDDSIVALTVSEPDSGFSPRVIRLGAEGQLDADFGSNGVVYDLPPGSIFINLAVLDGGKLLLAGLSKVDQAAALLVRLKPDGKLDTDFGNAGSVQLESPDYQDMRAFTIALSRPDGAVVVGGWTDGGVVYGGWIARVLQDGALDGRFNQGVPLFLDHRINTLATQDDNKVVFHGSIKPSSDSYLSIGRVDDDGSLDATFGTGGVVISPFPSPFSNAYSRSVIQGQKLFLSDVSQRDDIYQIQLLRYLLS